MKICNSCGGTFPANLFVHRSLKCKTCRANRMNELRRNRTYSEVRTCSKCSASEDTNTFPKSGRVCQPCKRAEHKMWRDAHPERARLYHENWLANGGRDRMKTPQARYRRCASSAKLRGFEFALTETDYFRLVARSCAYCGGPLDPFGHGLDRIDPTRGYTPSNVVQCCGVCNLTKSSLFTYEEFLKVGVVIREIRAERVLRGPPLIPRAGRGGILAKRRARGGDVSLD